MCRAVATVPSARVRRSSHPDPTSAADSAPRRRLLVGGLPLALLLSLAGRLPGQAAPRTVSGVVQDSTGRPLPDAVVVLDPNDQRRAMEADAQGRFRFDKVKSGEHQLRTVWVGYQPDDRKLTVPDSGLEVTIVLTQNPVRLDTIRIVTRAQGILGTTVDGKDLRALGGTDVEVVGTKYRTRTKADGRFAFLQLRPGGYVVRASRKGFSTLLVPVIVRRDKAVEVSMDLDTVTTKAAELREVQYFDLRQRVDRRSMNNSAIIPRQELAGRGGATLDLALMYSPSFLLKGLRIGGEERVFVNGRIAHGMHLRDYFADDAAMVEIYGSGPHQGGLQQEQECGYPPTTHEFVVGDRGQKLTYVEPSRPGLVDRAYIWLKGN